MNNINVTVNLCAEDRARLDKIIDLLSARASEELKSGTEAKPQDDIQKKLAEVVASVSTETVENATDEAETPTTTENPTEPINEAQEEPAEAMQAEEPKKPTVTMAMLTNKAITLSAAGMKDKVRDVVHQYAKTVTSLPADKWDEVYEKLNALEG
jgi:hypothetical protein